MLRVQQAFLCRLDEYEVVRPRRSAGGQRRYSRQEIVLVRYVVSLTDEGMTLSAIRRILRLERLTVRNLVNNHCLARAISDAGWADLRSMLEYKASWYGRQLLTVDRFFPSSKLCSTPGCSHLNGKMPLNVRSWTCPSCGTTHDRDVNAAPNILAAGLAER